MYVCYTIIERTFFLLYTVLSKLVAFTVLGGSWWFLVALKNIIHEQLFENLSRSNFKEFDKYLFVKNSVKKVP